MERKFISKIINQSVTFSVCLAEERIHRTDTTGHFAKNYSY